MAFTIGQKLRLRFGSYGTQLAVVEQIGTNKIGVRRFRANRGIWNKHLEWWRGEANLAQEVRLTAQFIESRALAKRQRKLLAAIATVAAKLED